MSKKLNNWYTHFVQNPVQFDDVWSAPELKKMMVGVSGNVENHPDFNDGDHITTSQVQNIYMDEEGKTIMITLSGSTYELGDPLEEYEKMIPKAKERLLNAFTKV